MSRTDDLVPLFGGDPGSPPLKFRQGQIVAWNPDTGQNTIDVQGVLLPDVPVMNTGEAIALKAGHVVGLVLWGHTWFIIGRITVPGDPDFASASTDFGLATGFANNFAVPQTTDATLVSATINCPTWARQAMVNMTAMIDLRNRRAAADFAWCTPKIATVTGQTSIQGFAANGAADLQDQQAVTLAHLLLVDLPGTPGQTIVCSALAHTIGGAWVADPFNTVFVSAAAIFKSTV